MLDIKICDREFLLVTLYNENNEKKEFACLNLLSEMLNNIPYIVKSIILGGNFNLFFVTSFETKCWNPILKKKSWAKLIEIKEIFHLYNIWRVRSPEMKHFNFIGNIFLVLFRDAWITF